MHCSRRSSGQLQFGFGQCGVEQESIHNDGHGHTTCLSSVVVRLSKKASYTRTERRRMRMGGRKGSFGTNHATFKRISQCFNLPRRNG